MSAFYDQASLVVVPSGYKSGKIYAQKPLTTDGQLTFTRASTATRVNASGLIETVSSGVPRLDYTNSSCPKLLLEPQRTNLLTYSEQFENAAYNKGTGGSISANTVIAPDGTTTADAYTWATSTSNYAYLSQSVSGTSQNANTFSIYIKRPAGSGSRTLRLTVSDVTTSTAFSSTFTVTEFWQRFEFSRTSAATTGNVGVGLMTGSTGVSIASGEVLHVWGAQLEVGAYATSYIPTTSAAVTRLADAASKTGISSLIGQTEGTVFVDINYTNTANTLDATPFRLLGSGSAQMYVEINTNDTFEVVVVNSAGTLVFNFTSAAQSAGRKKIAIAYKGSDFAYYINGVQIAAQASGAFASASLDTFNLGMYSSTVQQLADGVNQALLFKTRLTNAQLAELTTL